MTRLETLWWKLNTAMGRTDSDTWWRVLLTARTIVYGIMLLTDSAHRAAWREIRNDR